MNTDINTLKSFMRHGTPDDVLEMYVNSVDVANDMDFGLLDNNVVVVDTEATGLSFNKDDLIQIAAAKISGGKIVDWYVTFADPGQLISEEIENLTHISNEDVIGAPTPNEAVAGLVDFAGDAVMVAHNIGFDKNFIGSYNSGSSLKKNIWIDTLDLARIAFPRLTSHRLIDLSRAFGIVESTHRADDDVVTTCVMLRIMLGCLVQMPIDIISRIANIAPVEMWSTVYAFQVLEEIKIRNKEEQMFGNDNVGFLKNLRLKNIHALPVRKKFDVELEDELTSVSDADIIRAECLQFCPNDEVADEFSETGLLSKIYPDYEVRSQQAKMSTSINDAFAESYNLVVEAGTGVGKSMAYLVPAIRMAQQNRITVGVSTKTNILLDQLIYHELPALKSQIPDLIYSALKGATHYICLRKTAFLLSRPAREVTFNKVKMCNAASVAGLLTYIYQTAYDDGDNLRINARALFRGEFTTPSHDCLRHKCAFYRNGCFVHGARKMAANSDIVVTNHSLTMCDARSDNSILPPIKYWIVDEAHGLESAARSTFAKSVSSAALMDIAKNLTSTSASRNVFYKLQKTINNQELVAKEEAQMDAATEREGKNAIFGIAKRCIGLGTDLASKAELMANNIGLLSAFAEKSKNGYEIAQIWINTHVAESEQFNKLYQYAKDFTQQAEDLLNSVNNLIAYMENYKSTEVSQIELAGFVFEVKEIIDALDIIFINRDERYVYSATVNLRGELTREQLLAELVSVGETLNESLYQQSRSVIQTSATLAIGKNFNPFLNAVGLLPDNTQTLQLSSHFDYDNNMVVYVASDMPVPGSAQYLPTLQQFLADLHLASNGSILNLFTNRREMERCHEYVQEIIGTAGLRAILQKWNVSTKGVRDEFIADKFMSLFATKSFWEGFDAPGDTLRGVVIPKLPFARPNDPLSLERGARENSAWFKYTMPEAVIEIKQAVGRLIRKSTDRGFIVFADSRIYSKHNSYGRKFLDSMPTKNIAIMSCNEIVADVKNGMRIDG